MYFIGVDVGGTQVKNGIFDESGNLIYKWAIDTDTSNSGNNIIPDIAASIRSVFNEQKLCYGEIGGCGMGVPGAVRADGSVNKCLNLGWGDISVKNILSEATGINNIEILNDANAAALGEQWMGVGKGAENLVFITLGTGIGGGIIINNEIVNGAFNAGGEIGHINVDLNSNRLCSCGKYGCFEQYASATGFVKNMEVYLEKTGLDSSLKYMDKFETKDIFDAAKSGDIAAMDVVEHTCEIIGRTLSAISCIIDPELYVIGGGVSKAGDILVNTIKKYYKKYAYHTSTETRFLLASLGNDAGIYGAAYKARKHYK